MSEVDKYKIIIRPTNFHYRANYEPGTWSGNVWLAVNPMPLPRAYHMDGSTDRGSYIHRGVGHVVDPEMIVH